MPALQHPRLRELNEFLNSVRADLVALVEGIFAAAAASGMADDTATSSMLGSLDRFVIEDGTFKPLVAPERLVPTADADLDASWASLVAVRERTLRAWKAVDGKDLTSVVAPHPRFGPLNGYEWLLFVGKHEERHIAQIRRVLAAK